MYTFLIHQQFEQATVVRAHYWFKYKIKAAGRLHKWYEIISLIVDELVIEGNYKYKYKYYKFSHASSEHYSVSCNDIMQSSTACNANLSATVKYYVQ